MRLYLMGKCWNLRFVRGLLRRSLRGECDPPEVKGKEIRIEESLQGEELLEVLIHEMLHAANWHASEEWVETTSRDLARALTRLGYRRAIE